MLKGFEYLKSLEKWDGSVSSANKFSRDGVRRALSSLGNPQDDFKIVHVAGTNGKGSTCCTIASVLGKAGHSVGLASSPHLTCFNERIIVDGSPVSDGDLNTLLLEIEALTLEGGYRLSFFEVGVVAAFLHFSRVGVEYGVIEVGLGGRLDATNVIENSELSVITSIGLEHVHILGHSEAQIAKEKAGIIKEGGRVVVGKVSKEARESIKQVADQRKACVEFEEIDFSVHSDKDLSVSVNSTLVRRACHHLGLSENAISLGISSAYWPCRFEVLAVNSSQVIIDCAHNPHAINSLIVHLDKKGIKDPIYILGFLQNKDFRTICSSLFNAVRGEFHIVPVPGTDRAESTAFIANELSCLEISVTEWADAMSCLTSNLSRQRPIVIAGSVYLAGYLRERVCELDSSIKKISDLKFW